MRASKPFVEGKQCNDLVVQRDQWLVRATTDLVSKRNAGEEWIARSEGATKGGRKPDR